MYFILSVLFFLFSVITLILCSALKEGLFPLFVQSEHAAKFKARLSRAVFQLMIDVKNDFVCHLETICEPDGDEAFEPYMDSPLHTCPPTEFILSPPKEEVGVDIDTNNNANNPPRRRMARRRGIQPIVPPADLPAQPPPPPLNNPNPAVLIERIPPGHARIHIAVARQLQQGEREVQNRIPRRVIQLRELNGLLSPPPQQNANNQNEQVAFPFE